MDEPLLGGERLEDRLGDLVGVIAPAHHQAVPVLEAPDASARPRVEEVDPPLRQLVGPAHRVAEVGVAAVDDDVASGELGGERDDELLGDLPRRHHGPDDARWLERGDHLVESRRRSGPELRQIRRAAGIDVVGDHPVPALEQALHHVAAHPSEAEHRDLHLGHLRASFTASRTASTNFLGSPSSTCTRSARRPRAWRTSRSPRAWAAKSVAKP